MPGSAADGGEDGGIHFLSSLGRVGARPNAEVANRGTPLREWNATGHVHPREVITRPQDETLGLVRIHL